MPRSARPWLLDTRDDDFVAARITSRSSISEYDLPIKDWQIAGLKVASYVRVHKLTVLAKAEVIRSVGSLSGPDFESLNLVLRRLFCEG